MENFRKWVDRTGVMPIVAVLALLCISVTLVISLNSDADVASRNLSKAADNFEVNRRVVFYNGVTGDYMLTVEGRCALGNADKPRQISITCKTGADAYKKHFLGLSDNVTYFVEQLDASKVSAYHYRVIFKPSVILPDVEVKSEEKS